jgi:hypothetical protein
VLGGIKLIVKLGLDPEPEESDVMVGAPGAATAE